MEGGNKKEQGGKEGSERKRKNCRRGGREHLKRKKKYLRSGRRKPARRSKGVVKGAYGYSKKRGKERPL